MPPLVAQEMFPEVFLKPREEYISNTLREICDEMDQEEDTSILAYVGDMHLNSIEKSWDISGRKVRTPFGKPKMTDPKMNFAKMMYIYRPENKETAED